MWRVDQIEHIFISIFLAFFIPQFGMAQNQTLRINIELPAGVGLSSGSSTKTGFEKRSGNDIRPDDSGTENFSLIAEDGSFLPLVWIKMVTYENSQFLLDFKDQGMPGKPSLIYFLNDNTNNLQSAQSLNKFPALLNFNQKDLLIRNFVPRTTFLNAWLGFSGENQLKTLLLEYF